MTEKLMTEKLYERDSYIKTFEAQVLSCEVLEGGYAVVVDKTAFFPEGGGQNPDTGLLGGAHVMDVQEANGVITHTVDQPLEMGSVVEGAVDWDVRFDRMQQHSGEHIVSGIVHRTLGYDNVGFHLGDDIVTMDFNGDITPETLVELEIAANKAIYDNRSIIVSYPDKNALKSLNYRSKIEIEGQVRIVTVEGIDVCACCAPHVTRTGEIGIIKILSCQKYKGGVRMSIACGGRALRDYQQKQVSVTDISVRLSAKQEQVAEAVEKLHQDLQETRYALGGLKERLMLANIEQLKRQPGRICLFVEGMESGPMRKALNVLMEGRSELCGLFDGDDVQGYKFLIGSSDGQARAALEALKQTFTVRGGGSPQMVQGQITGSKAAIQAAFEAVKAHE